MLPLDDDLLALGAALMPDAALLRCALGDEIAPGDAEALSFALGLDETARTEALRAHPLGPRLLAALELGRRVLVWTTPRRAALRGPSDAAAVLERHLPDGSERLCVVALDRQLQVGRVTTLCGGWDPNRISASRAAVLGPVLAAGCSALLVGHRHPSGRADASAADAYATRALARAARAVDLTLLDHVILGGSGHLSLVREGVLAGDAARYR